MFIKKLETLFVGIMIVAIIILANNWHTSSSFKNNPISDEYKNLIAKKEQEILRNMHLHYGIKIQIPLIVTDRFKDRLFGAAVYKDGDVKIYLNKNVMQESMKYMLDSVIAHEYAHALMLKKRMNTSENDGHSAEWREICTNLGGVNCGKYVDVNDVVMGKMPF